MVANERLGWVGRGASVADQLSRKGAKSLGKWPLLSKADVDSIWEAAKYVHRPFSFSDLDLKLEITPTYSRPHFAPLIFILLYTKYIGKIHAFTRVNNRYTCIKEFLIYHSIYIYIYLNKFLEQENFIIK